MNWEKGQEGRTRISANNRKLLREAVRTPEEMVEFLKSGAEFRSFDYLLRQLYPGEDLMPRLVSGLEKVTGESHDSIARKARNWLNGKNTPKSRELLFQISFVLGLDEFGADRLLACASETGIHYRNPRELAYACALRLDLPYEEADELAGEAETVCGKFKEKKEKEKKEKNEKNEKLRGMETGRLFTRQVRDAFDEVWSKEEFRDFIQEYGDSLGTLHETAYRDFQDMLTKLQRPESGVDLKEKKYSMEEILTDYIRMKVPETKRVGGYSALQRLVKKYWPNESSLINMRRRKEDVSRKAMILLYLVTEALEEAEDPDDPDAYFWEDMEEEDEDSMLEIRIRQMDIFLERYGMNPLDCGSPFDLMVMYAMRTQGDELTREGMGDRMRQVVEILFSEEETEKS